MFLNDSILYFMIATIGEIMLECLIIGDSIAVGTANVRPDCISYAKGGINSWQWVNQNISKTPLVAKTVIISLGSNDHKGVKTEKELETIRELTKADRVYWILPHGNNPKSNVSIEDIQTIVKQVADRHGDIVLPITRVQKDNIHPSWAGYKELAEKTK
jgi:lysophospholipase L1-like esterase